MSYRYTFALSKSGEMIYLSHLDLMRLLARACRRAGIPVALTQGFSPHPRIRVERAMKLGVSFEDGAGEMVLVSPMPPDDLAARLRTALPGEICVKEIVLQS
jgi:radical SAM-linked protein